MEAPSLQSASQAQQDGFSSAGVGAARSTASQVAALNLTDAQLAGLQATFGLTDAQLRGVQTDATVSERRAPEPAPRDERSLSPTGPAHREQGSEWRSSNHVRFGSSPSHPQGSSDPWHSGSTSGDTGFGGGSCAPSGNQRYRSSMSGDIGFGSGSNARGEGVWYRDGTTNDAGFGGGSSATSGDQRHRGSTYGDGVIGGDSSAQRGDQRYRGNMSGDAGIGGGSNARGEDVGYRDGTSSDAGFGGGSSVQRSDQRYRDVTSGDAGFGGGSSAAGAGYYGSGRREHCSYPESRYTRSATEPTLAEQAQSNATTAHIESKMGSVTDPKFDKDANLQHPMHALSKAAVFGGGNLASQLAPGQEFGPRFVPAVAE